MKKPRTFQHLDFWSKHLAVWQIRYLWNSVFLWRKWPGTTGCEFTHQVWLTGTDANEVRYWKGINKGLLNEKLFISFKSNRITSLIFTLQHTVFIHWSLLYPGTPKRCMWGGNPPWMCAFKPVGRHVFGRREETGELGGNPHGRLRADINLTSESSQQAWSCEAETRAATRLWKFEVIRVTLG